MQKLGLFGSKKRLKMNEILDQPIEPNKEAKLHPVVKLFGAFVLARLIGVYFLIMSIPYGDELMSISAYGIIIFGFSAFILGLINKNKRTDSIDLWSLVFIIGIVINTIDFALNSASFDPFLFSQTNSVLGKTMFTIGIIGMMICYFDLFKQYPIKGLKFPVLIGLGIIVLLNLLIYRLPGMSAALTVSILLLLIVSLVILIRQWLSKESFSTKLLTSAFLISFAMIFVGILAKVESLPLTIFFEVGIISFVILLAFEILLKDLISSKQKSRT